MTDTVLRVYEPHELGRDGYPFAWHALATDAAVQTWLAHVVHGKPPVGGWGVKDVVRAQAGHRCERCGHPYAPGCGTWGGVTQEIGDEVERAVLFAVEDDRPEMLDPASHGRRAVLWSPCDEHCTHAGPTRAVDAQRDNEVIRFSETEMVDGGSGGYWEVQAAWRILTVHHLNQRKFDLRWWNLCALCQRCHLHIQKKVQMERVFPFEHTDWFKPFAAGWYSYAYEGIERTREEVVADLDRLLALERVA